MIDNALRVIRTKLNTYFRNLGEATNDKVLYIDNDQTDEAIFHKDKVSLALINIEEERVLRQPDHWGGHLKNGVMVGRNPEIRIQLLILFVARYSDYEQSMKSLSQIIRFFQAHRVFQHADTPELDDDIERMILELQTMPIAQQNDLWNGMRTSYHPSVAYKVGVLRYQDGMSMQLGGEVKEVVRDIKESRIPDNSENLTPA